MIPFCEKISHRKTPSFESLSKHPRHFQSFVPPPRVRVYTNTYDLYEGNPFLDLKLIRAIMREKYESCKERMLTQ